MKNPLVLSNKPTNKTMKKTPKLHINIWKAKDGFRWNMKRSGRIVAESGEAYCRLKTCTTAIENIIHCIDVCAFEWVLPKS